MISVMSNGFEANRINEDSVEDSVEETRLRVSNTSSRNTTSPAYGSEEARVSMDVKGDSRVSDSQTEDSRVLTVKKEGDEITKVRKVKDEEKDVDLVKHKGKKGKLKEPVVSEYDLMLSKFDEYAGNGKRWDIGFGFQMGDMVWGKVKSHPWWPGHIFSEAFATPSVRRSKREGHILVAFYGDSSYGWFDPDELVHFEPTFGDKSVQTNVKNFVKAVEEAVDEVGRRSALGLVCHCRKRNNFRATEVDGFFSVDFSEYEKNCTYSASQIKKARECFQPKQVLDFIRKCALKPRRSDEGEDLSFIKKKATVLAYRKAVFEEDDPTYAEAFGIVPSKQTKEAVHQPFSRQPSSRAPLSGRLVYADTLRKGKSSTKSNKMKDQVEKDRYLFKRRDEPGSLKTHQVGAAQAGSSDQPIHLDGSSLAGKDVSPSAADLLPSPSGATLVESFKQPSSPVATAGETDGQIQAEDDGSDVKPSVPAEARVPAGDSRVNFNSGLDKVKIRKRSAGEISGGSSPSKERKKKKKKATLGLNTNSSHVEGQASVSSENLGREKVARESVQVPSASSGEKLQMDIQQKGDAIDSPAAGHLITNEDKAGIRSNNIELPQVLSDLHAFALDPFYEAENNNMKTMRALFLKFRSLVYQKSLALSAESESSTPVNKSPVVVVAPTAESPVAAPITNSAKQTVKLKPQKNLARPDDPTKGGRKRGPSDRQEEMAVKKKKKISDLRALAAEKKASMKAASEVQQGESNKEMPAKRQGDNNKEMPAKRPASTLVRVSKPDIVKRGPVEKVPEPTMLIMKFPPNGALPSISELKARFARFGTLDHSATRVFWKSSTCRLVYKYRHHAVAAYKFAVDAGNLFGSSVKCHIRDVTGEAQEIETSRVAREDAGASIPKDGAGDSRPSAKSTSQSGLKSCLKKPPGEEGQTTNGGNGSNRAPRVKFMLGGENNRGEQTNDSMNVNNTANTSGIADGNTSSSSSNINNLKGIPQTQSSMPPPPPPAQYVNAPTNVQFTHQVAFRNVPNYNSPVSLAEVDISQQMLGLLTKCSDIVSNLSGLLGYAPYHPL